jgi:hypothetical protein
MVGRRFEVKLAPSSAYRRLAGLCPPRPWCRGPVMAAPTRRRGPPFGKLPGPRVREVGAGPPPGTPVEVWFQDGWTRHASNRVGRKGTLTRLWAETGARAPRRRARTATDRSTRSAPCAPGVTWAAR